DDFLLGTVELADADGEPIDISDLQDIVFLVKAAAGEEGQPLIEARVGPASLVTGIVITDAAAGQFALRVNKEDIAAIPGAMEIVRLAWNLRIVDADGTELTYAHGPCEIVPEVIDG